jgi:phage terminase large subunit-like protein
VIDTSSATHQHKLTRVGFDRFNASQIVIELEQDGVVMLPYGQGYVSMSFPMKELERMIYGGLIEFEDDPVIRWMFSNVAIETDASVNIKASKRRAQDKIDGVVALIMAIGTWMHNVQEEASNPAPSIIRI